MIAYLSVVDKLIRFRTEDNSIDVYFNNTSNVVKIHEITGFNNGVIDVTVKTDVVFNKEHSIICTDNFKISYDMSSILDLLGISTVPLLDITEVRLENADINKNEYYFNRFSLDDTVYIEVTDKEKKYRSVHYADSAKLIATTMPPDMVAEYEGTLRELRNVNSFGEPLYDDEF